MPVTLKFLGALRHASGKAELSFPCKDEGSVLDLVDALTKQAPELRRNLLDEQLEAPKPNALMLVNGKEISILDGLDTKVNDGDEIVFVPVVHGG
ncbi:MAG: MoaD/ThiS family protein [Candidatus Bathyarchaeota archaeon]|nr:MoaD/ThiS family protein [Candidatus Bathyarchaeota archaeon]